MKAVFLDRDGVVIKDTHHLHSIKDVELLPKAAEAIRKLNEKDYKAIIITNQPVVARGLCTEEEAIEINNYIKELLLKENARIDAVYYCPHHPTAGDNPKYTKVCECRKPKPGMILQAARDFKINNLEECFIVGDTTGDIKAGKAAGCKTILVKTGYGGKDGFQDAIPDYTTDNLYTAVASIILKENNI